ncbi:MAG TPA: hypothetical protein VJL80_05835 [Aeromicrobium sp.]|nr:hypothetical protein [Aeromicrobium sp.]HKY57539.1 hypothetical protein [Aeromicrobium sp.]
MAATVIVAVRKAVVAAVADLAPFTDVPVMYAFKATTNREFAYTRDATFEHGAAAMKSGRNFRDEVGRFEFVIWVEAPGDSAEEAADRALVFGLAFEEWVADNKAGVGGAYAIQVEGGGQIREATGDQSSYAELVYPIKYNARLT